MPFFDPIWDGHDKCQFAVRRLSFDCQMATVPPRTGCNGVPLAALCLTPLTLYFEGFGGAALLFLGLPALVMGSRAQENEKEQGIRRSLDNVCPDNGLTIL